LAVFCAYLAEASSNERDFGMAIEYLNRATELVSAQPMAASLYNGFTGVAWAMEHLKARLFETDVEDPNAEIDAALEDHLNQAPWQGAYDLIYGLVGFGVYALERLPRTSGVTCLERVVDRLEEIALRQTEGVAWFTPPRHLPVWQRARFVDGYFNLGLAHGVPAVIALLGRSYEEDVARGKALPLLKDAVRWLLTHKLDESAEWAFPSFVVPGMTSGASRLGWCYGDPGIAAALLGAARAVKDRNWEDEAVAIARRSGLPRKHSGVVDAGLCHGAAGLGHLYNRLYQATGDAALGEMARLWFETTLEMRKAGEGIAGYSAWLRREGDTMGWVADPGLLNGAAGIALAFLAAATPIEPQWDRILLVTVPPLPAS
jgi:lantibiotic modifying enzyme